MKYVSLQFSPSFLYLASKYSAQHPTFKHPECLIIFPLRSSVETVQLLRYMQSD